MVWSRSGMRFWAGRPKFRNCRPFQGWERRHYSGGALPPASPAAAPKTWQTLRESCSCVLRRRRRWRPVPLWTRSTCWVLSLEELEGIPVDEQLALIRDRLSEVHDPAQRLFLAEELLGGSSERLVSALSATSDELDRFKVSSDETIETLSAADRLVQEFTERCEGRWAATFWCR